ncbi:LacI family DNA-binding transcriptional regulator [Paenarthrobacter aromaticivorans]|uniref:LacI family DNA-binding transcriptional regulator n=1 Tax=Paenarthrobacter aromaticivorans TaxID=2849150 RepID=UPI003A80F736
MTRTLTRRATAADVAREAGVSPATVGFVLNRTKGQTISEETRARVLAAAAALNYKPHHAARALRSGKSKIVLLVLPDWPLEHSLRTNLEALTHTLGAHGYALITFTPQPNSSATPLWAVLEPAVVIGYRPFSAEDLADLKILGIHNIIPNPEAPSMGAVADLESGPRLQTEHLLSLGHTKLGFACPPDPRLAAFIETRLDVVTKVCTQAGISSPLVRQVDYRDGSSISAAAQWVAEGVTGVVAYNDDVAADVIAGAVRSGLNVPDDLSVIGHDNSPVAGRFVPSISSVEIDMESLGKQSAHLALNLAEGYPMPAFPVAAASLVHRESTAQIAQSGGVLGK